MNRIFDLRGNNTNIKTELVAGITGFLSVVYIVVVNSTILEDAGIALEAGIVATIISSFIGCLIMAFWANAPLIVMPGMGLNTLFTYTMVLELGLDWREALMAVFLSGLIFLVISLTKLSLIISEAIPKALKAGISAGIGFFITLIGLQKGGVVVPNPKTFLSIGSFKDPVVIMTMIGLIITTILYFRGVKSGFLLNIIIITLISLWLVPTNIETQTNSFSIATYLSVLGSLSLGGIFKAAFWSSVFSLTMVLIFDTMSINNCLLGTQKTKLKRALQANAVSSMSCGVIGTSPTLTASESACATESGGKTGLTSLVTGSLFLVSLLFVPIIKYIPDSAIAPILILVGGLLAQNIKDISIDNMSEWIPGFIAFSFIPLTYSIPDGIAISFIAYALIQISLGNTRNLNPTFLIISLLFLVQMAIHI